MEEFRKMIRTKKKVYVIGILAVLLFTIAGTVFFVSRNNNQSKNGQSAEKQKEENYLSLSVSDREVADLYAQLYEVSREDVAEQQAKNQDWEKTAKDLEKLFFTISENKKYQMIKEGYAPEDLQEAESLSAKTGRKALELAEAKGKASDNKSWSDVVKDSEILSAEEQLGLSKEQVEQLKDRSLKKEDRMEVAIMVLNETYTFNEIIKKLDNGNSVSQLTGQE